MRTIQSIVVAAVLIAAAATASAQEIRGAWTATAADLEAGKITMQFSRNRSNNTWTMDLGSFTGISEADVMSATQRLVNFTLQREAGTVALEGTFKAGFGAGQFAFIPNRQYIQTLENLGISTEPKKRKRREASLDERLFHLALGNVSTAFIRSMQAEGYNVSLDDYVAFGIFGVNPELVRELRSLGYDNVSADKLVATRIHRVTPDYIRAMNDSGFRNLSLDDLIGMRIHGVTTDFIREIRQLGYENVSVKKLMSMRIHGVTPEFITELRQLGYDNITADKLVSMRIHGVTPKFIRELESAGYRNIPVDKLISMRIHGVDAEFARKMNGL